MSYGKIDIHDFYCMKCGQKAMSCVRPQAHRREQFHRKKLYCPHCRTTLNCVEVKNDTEAFEFREMFEAGEFEQEAILSLEECAVNGQKKLIIMCGPAGSGKTTWVQDHASPGVSAHISRDRIRFDMVKEDEYYFSREDDVYVEFINQIVRALNSPWVDEVYADATHLTKNARKKLIREIDNLSVLPYDLIAIIIKPELEQCLTQNAQRSGREFVPETVIRNMYKSFQHPLKDDLNYEMIIENDKIVYGKVDE